MRDYVRGLTEAARARAYSGSMSAIHIGISGWRYEPWRGAFYPDGLRQDAELHYASRAVTSIEINGSFYALQKPDSYAAW